MPRFATADGKGTNDPTKALQKAGQPVSNAAREIWVTETALTTALNTAYFAESVATFAIVMGFALLITGSGFLVLTLRVLRKFEREPHAATRAPATAVTA